VTANVLRVKVGWAFAMDRAPSADPDVVRVQADVLARCDQLFARAQAAGVLRADVDLPWARRRYYALIHEASQDRDEADADALATLVVDTLLRGPNPLQSH
jgi:hypothetical protein